MAELVAEDAGAGSTNGTFARSRTLTVVAVVLLTLILAAVTGPRVFTAALWGDELRTWRDGIEKPLSDILHWRHNADHAPLGHLLARGGATRFGADHPWALRLGSWLCGIACVPALWWMGRTLWDSTVGLAMALMAVVDPNLISQMTLARMYAPLLLAAIVAFNFAGRIIVRPDRPWRNTLLLSGGLGIALGVGIWTHAQIYALVIAMVLVGLAMLVKRDSRRGGTALLLAVVIGGAIGAQGVAKIISRHDAETIVTADVTDAPGGQLEDGVHKLTGKAWITYVVLGTVIGGLAIVAANRPTHRWLAVLLGTLIIVALLNVLIAARYRPVSHARYLTVVEPALWFCIAVAVVDVFRTHRRNGVAGPVFAWLAFCGWAGLCVYEATRLDDALDVHPLAQPFADAAREIRASIKDDDRFVMVARSPYGMYTRYYGLKLDDPLDDAMTASSSSRIARGKAAAAELDRGVIWLLCVIPPPNIKYRNPLDDPATVVQMIADSRHLKPGKLDALARSDRWHAAVVRIDQEHVEVRRVLP